MRQRLTRRSRSLCSSLFIGRNIIVWGGLRPLLHGHERAFSCPTCKEYILPLKEIDRGGQKPLYGESIKPWLLKKTNTRIHIFGVFCCYFFIILIICFDEFIAFYLPSLLTNFFFPIEVLFNFTIFDSRHDIASTYTPTTTSLTLTHVWSLQRQYSCSSPLTAPVT